MSEPSSSWLPVVTGFGVIALTLVAIAIFPRTWWARELTRCYGVRPTGPDGRYRRRDALRGAGLSALLGTVLLAAGFGVFAITEPYPDLSTLNRIGSTYLVAFSILGGMAYLGALLLLWRAAFWRDSLPSHTDGPGRDA